MNERKAGFIAGRHASGYHIVEPALDSRGDGPFASEAVVQHPSDKVRFRAPGAPVLQLFAGRTLQFHGSAPVKRGRYLPPNVTRPPQITVAGLIVWISSGADASISPSSMVTSAK